MSKRLTPVEGLDNFVKSFYEKHPEHKQEIGGFLQPYRLPDGKLQYDDDIMLGLRELARKGKWSAQKAAATRQLKK